MSQAITVFATFSFEAAHYLPNVPAGHKCNRLHGHNWVVEIYAQDVPVEPFGWVIDFYEIEKEWLKLFAQLDHRVINDVDGLENPTSENLARWIGTRLKTRIKQLIRVVVKETPLFGAIYEVR